MNILQEIGTIVSRGLNSPTDHMDLGQFGDELKKQRLARQVSLTDISAETRINIRFLEAIERGDFHVLPQTYVRAFLREYALIVELQPDEILRQYNDILDTSAPPPPAGAAHGGRSSLPVTRHWTSVLTSQQKRIAVIGVLIVLGLIAVLVANIYSPADPSATPTEVSFDRVIRESEAAAARQTPLPPPVTRTLPAQDSLRLEISTIDSVWISLLIDDRAAEEYLFAPNRKRIWVAKDRFVITMGNAGGATFRLNGSEIGALGRRGAVLRSATITAATLSTITSPERRPL